MKGNPFYTPHSKNRYEIARERGRKAADLVSLFARQSGKTNMEKAMIENALGVDTKEDKE